MTGAYALAQPVGRRSCRTPDDEPGEGGTWGKCIRLIGSSHADDLEECLKNLAPVARRYFIADLHLLMDRASRGDLVLDRQTTRGGDVVHCGGKVGVANVLEARMSKQIGEEGAQLTRLYYSEPRGHAGALLWLSLQWKRPGPIGLEEQDGHIREADRRLALHFQNFEL